MKKTIFLTVLVLIVFGLTLFSGRSAFAGETTGEYIDDTSMHAKVNAIVVKDPDANYFKVDVTVTQGDVVLTGFVNSRETEERLVAKIRAISGVKSVKSLLKMEKK